jgi:hypothetical protein
VASRFGCDGSFGDDGAVIGRQELVELSGVGRRGEKEEHRHVDTDVRVAGIIKSLPYVERAGGRVAPSDEN